MNSGSWEGKTSKGWIARGYIGAATAIAMASLGMWWSFVPPWIDFREVAPMAPSTAVALLLWGSAFLMSRSFFGMAWNQLLHLRERRAGWLARVRHG